VVQVAHELRGGGSSVTAEPVLGVQDLRVSYYVVSSMAPLSVHSEGVQEFLSEYKAKYPNGTPSRPVRSTPMRAPRSPTRR
jgi:hypothetical protein